MAQTTNKRKSESALPPAKHRKGEQSFSPTPSPESDAPSDGLPIQDAHVAAKHVKKRVRKSEPAPETRVDEYDEDVGRMESQSFLALVEFESKKKRKVNKESSAFMEEWEKCIGDKADELRLNLDEAQKKSTQRNTQFLDSFKSAYGASRAHVTMPDQGNGQNTSSVPNFAALYSKSKEITNTAFALIAKFEEVSQRIKSIDTAALIENEWGEQDTEMAALLHEGKQIGVEKYRSILNGSKDTKEMIPEGRNAGTGDYFFDRDDRVKGVWGEVAKKQVKAMKKLVKTVQVEVA